MGIRKLAGLLVVVALVAVLIIPGCGGGGAVTPPTPPPAGEHEEMTLIGATYAGPMYSIWPAIEAFVDYINEHGEGIVQIDWYHSSTLLDAKSLMPGLMAGTADFINFTDSYMVGSNPIMGVRQLPFLYANPEQFHERTKPGTPITNLVNEHLAKNNLYEISYGGLLPENLWTASVPVRSPADMKGLKLRVAGLTESHVAAALGAAPTTIPSAEAYLALQRGTVDGAIVYPGTIDARALYEIIDYCTYAPFTWIGAGWYVPLDRWESWPQDVKDLFLKAGEPYAYDVLFKDIDYFPQFKEAGMTIIELSPEEYNAFKEACNPVYDQFVKSVGTEVGTEALRLVQEGK